MKTEQTGDLYLTPYKRGKDKGQELYNYAKQFFKRNNVGEYHLRVSPTIVSAVWFYRKMGMNEIGPEMNGKVIRMRAYRNLLGRTVFLNRAHYWV
ncbi:GNAT family N-acetyltransferase [Lentibacillus cibarius]|uniref:GNAT family N-acetyltransferase n=1 Tax=Lentibacillus cibarius TaxID=2583219 RepID=A0A5S3R854_9BACI|nr:GNAT family N-acetyltransferase [Lentibacillus cibarius]TMN23743.1 GNAT family N-acetyltransferase [Lentibacillus cibarius]